jgi:hypothetical protein
MGVVGEGPNYLGSAGTTPAPQGVVMGILAIVAGMLGLVLV